MKMKKKNTNPQTSYKSKLSSLIEWLVNIKTIKNMVVMYFSDFVIFFLETKCIKSNFGHVATHCTFTAVYYIQTQSVQHSHI